MFAEQKLAGVLPVEYAMDYDDKLEALVEARYKHDHGQVVTQAHFLRTVQGCNFRDEQAWDQIHYLYGQDAQPLINLGTSRGHAYVFSPSGSRLLPTEPWRDTPADVVGEFLPESFVGVNRGVEPAAHGDRARSGRNLPVRSVRTPASDDTAEEGTVFFQIGELLYAEDTENRAQEEGARPEFGWKEKKWEYAYFMVCVDVSDGRARGVWLLFDFTPQDEDGNREPWADNRWGLLPNYASNEQYSMVKITDSLDDIGVPFDLTKSSESYSYVPEYVYIRQRPGGPLLREWV